MHWIKDVEMVESVDDLKSSQSSGRRRFKIASFPRSPRKSVLPRRRIKVEEQKTQLDDRFLRGRQIAFMIYEFFP